MASPLTPVNGASLNAATPPTQHHNDYEVQSYTAGVKDENMHVDLPHEADRVSPLPSAIKHEPNAANQENSTSPRKNRHSRVLSGNELSPLKILRSRDDSSSPSGRPLSRSSSPQRSPRKSSPEKRFPVRVTNITPTPEELPPPPPAPPSVHEREMTLDEALQENKDLEHAIKIFEDEDTIMSNADEDDEEDDHDAVANATSISARGGGGGGGDAHDEAAGADDTMVSTFSTFSAVPNMTMFNRIGHSPTRFANLGTSPSPSARTPRPPTMHHHDSGSVGKNSNGSNTTNLLMDFTDQLNGFGGSRRGGPSPSRRPGAASPFKASSAAADLLSATPRGPKSGVGASGNLLDFDMPPLPTPRSLPTITPRELESLKSGFLSEISSLKASLSGKEAEVSSLKTAVGDAETRVGECMEQLRESQGLREALAGEKEAWERRGAEMDGLLRGVREELAAGQRDREELESKFEESEKRREAAEMMAQDAESKMAGMRAGKESGDSDPSNKSPEKAQAAAAAPAPGSREIEIAVERVARELHSAYKSKHEKKVTKLKESYEAKWEKKVSSLERRVRALGEENERLSAAASSSASAAAADTTLARLDLESREELMAQQSRDQAQIRELTAEAERFGAVATSLRGDNEALREQLERERVEKGELVMLAEEMMQMQANNTTVMAQHQQQQQHQMDEDKEDVAAAAAAAPTRPAMEARTPARPGAAAAARSIPSTMAKAQAASDSYRSSLSSSLNGGGGGAGGRPSGLKAPGSNKRPAPESQMGRPGHERTKSGGGGLGLPRPGGGVGIGGGRSGMMSSIESMGKYRGRGE